MAWFKEDRSGRIVGKVMIDGADVALMQVKAGLAWRCKRFQREQSPGDRMEYAAAEENARNQHKGLWEDSRLLPLWE